MPTPCCVIGADSGVLSIVNNALEGVSSLVIVIGPSLILPKEFEVYYHVANARASSCGASEFPDFGRWKRTWTHPMEKSTCWP